MRARLLLCLWAMALPAGCGRPDGTTVTVTLRIDAEVFRPDFVLLGWRLVSGRDLFQDVRLPERGVLARQGAVLGSVQFQIEPDLAGDRQLQVSGLRGEDKVAGAMARIPWMAGSDQQVTLTMGCSEDLAAPEAIAACAPSEPAPPPDVDAGQPQRDALERPPEPPTLDAHPRDARSSDTPPADAGIGPPDGAGVGNGGDASSPRDADDAAAGGDGRPEPIRDGGADQRLLSGHPAPTGVDLGRGLLLYLRMNEGAPSATTRDGSGRQNQVILVGLDVKTAWIEGPLGEPALGFPAAGPAPGWVRVASSPALNEISGGFTIAAWVRAPRAGSAARRTIAARRSVGPGGFLYSLHLIGDRPGVYIHSTNGANVNLVSPAALPPDTWVHVALVYDLLSAQLLVDGRLVAQQPYQLSIGPEISPLTLGASEDATIITNGSDPLGGDLDEIVVYDHALGAPEITALATGAQPALR
jgi:hypothetical protein